MNTRFSPRSPFGRGGGFGGGGFESPFGPAPKDFYALVAVVFATFTLFHLGGEQLVPMFLWLDPLVWQMGFVWKLVTYPFAGYGPPSLWILLELLILYWFGRTVRLQLGRKLFWRTLLTVAVGAGVAAVAVQLAMIATVGAYSPAAFSIMQGQRLLLAFSIAAFASLNANATILLFFVLPVQARWFLWIEVLFAFVAFLGNKDFAGFVGVAVAVWLTNAIIRAGGFGKIGRLLRQSWLRMREKQLRAQLDREKRKRGLRVVRDDDEMVH